MKSLTLPFSRVDIEITRDMEGKIYRDSMRYKEWRRLKKRERDQVRKRQKEQKAVHFPTPLADPIHPPGSEVMLWQDSRNPRSRREYGRVICNVWNKFIGTWDTYVAFFGFKWPSKDYQKMEYPYVLRYFETSLKKFKPKKETVR